MQSLSGAIRVPQSNIRSAGTVRPAARPPLHRLQSTVGNETMRRLLEADRPGSSAIPPVVESALRLPGQPMPASTRAEMESRFGEDFGDVRLHVGGEAAESAAAVGASAYTVGRDIVFGTGSYAPESASGREVLAHELAHVVQQGRGGAAPSLDSEPQLESGARDAAAAVMNGSGPVQVSERCRAGAAGERAGRYRGENEAALSARGHLQGPGGVCQERRRITPFQSRRYDHGSGLAPVSAGCLGRAEAGADAGA